MTERQSPPTSPAPPVPVARVRDADATRARVIEAAEALFARKGFDGTRLREVAEDARVTVPLLCHHFGDKESLYTAVIERGIERFASLGWEVLRLGQGIAEQLAGFITGLIDLAARDPNLTTLLHREMTDGGVRARPLAERWLLPVKAAATEALQAAQRRGEIRAGLDLDMVVLCIVGAVMYPCIAGPLVQIVWGEDPGHAAFIERRRRALLDLLLPLVVTR